MLPSIIALSVLALHIFLCFRKHWIWGGLVPALTLALRQHRANGLLSRKSIPTINHDRDTPLKCLHVRTDSSRQTWSVSQNQIRKCE